MVFTLGLRHTFALWQRALALVESLAVQPSLASLRTGVVKTFRYVPLSSGDSMLKRFPRRIRLRTLLVLVALSALLMAYAGRYIQLRERSRAETEEYGLVGILYAPAADVIETQDLSLHYRRCAIFAPANWVDRTFFGGDAPIACIMFSLD